MATCTPPRLYRRLRKASDVCTVTTVSPFPKRMRMSKEHMSCCEDRISNLPDEILFMILDKLDARTMITTTILSKLWRDLPRRLYTSYHFSVDEILPPHYHRLKQLAMEVMAGYKAEKNEHKLTDICAFEDRYERYYAFKDRHEQWMGMVRLLTPILQCYERWAM